MDKLLAWAGHEFESSCYKTPEFKKFASDVKRAIKSPNLAISFNVGHFYVSGMVRNAGTGKYAYFSVSDVRFFPDEWKNNVLFRTAEHSADWTGGRNQYCNIQSLVRNLEHITQ